jgi:glycosyltransferase 2 family protein
MEVHPHWGMIALSCAIVLAAYALLIETWRRILAAWGERLGFGDAARIWLVSGLARYLPGVNQVFVLGAMAELARRRRISPVAATGAAVINTAVNIASGFVIALLAGFAALDRLSKGHATLGIVVAVVLLVGLLILPAALPWILGVVQRVTGRQLALGVLPRSAIYVSLTGNLIAWAMYGLAFQCFARGVTGQFTGALVDYIAVWAGAYVIGYLAFLLPAGLGVREVALIDGLTILRLTTPGPASVIAVSARLWLTVLEIAPALIFLALGTRPRPQATTPRDGPNS